MHTLDFAGIVGLLIGFVNRTIPVLIALALVYFLWGCVQYVMSPGGEGGHGQNPRETIIWGLIALVVVVSIAGILNFLCLSFVQSATCR